MNRLYLLLALAVAAPQGARAQTADNDFQKEYEKFFGEPLQGGVQAAPASQKPLDSFTGLKAGQAAALVLAKDDIVAIGEAKRREMVLRMQRLLKTWNERLTLQTNGQYDAPTAMAVTLFKAIYKPDEDDYDGGFIGPGMGRLLADYERARAGDSAVLQMPKKTYGGEILYAASRYLGVQYTWGGTSASRGVDCSGLVLNALAYAGNDDVDHNAMAQFKDSEKGRDGLYLYAKKTGGKWYRSGVPEDLEQKGAAAERMPFYPSKVVPQPQPGDLVFFSRRGTRKHHVGVYVANGYIIDASSGRDRVLMRKLSIFGRQVSAFARPYPVTSCSVSSR